MKRINSRLSGEIRITFTDPKFSVISPATESIFTKRDKLLTEATICFHCHNIYFYKTSNAKTNNKPIDVNFGSFMRETDDSNAARFRAYLASLFPGHNPDVESTERPN